jgi:hypothetical protein
MLKKDENGQCPTYKNSGIVDIHLGFATLDIVKIKKTCASAVAIYF